VAEDFEFRNDVGRSIVERLRLLRKLLEMLIGDLGRVGIAHAALGATVRPNYSGQALQVERQGQQNQQLQPLSVDARRVFHQRLEAALEQHL